MLKNLVLIILLLEILSGTGRTCSVHKEDIKNKIETIRKDYDNIGLSVVVVKNNRIVYSDNFGYNPDITNPSEGEPINKKDLFYIASVSKTFVGTAIMQLVEEGKLSLEDDVNKYLSFSLRNPNFPETPITIRMLLSHCSSLKKGADYDDFDKINPEKASDLQGFYNNYLPGTKTEYSNLGYVILGAVIENITGMRFDDCVQKQILKPLRLQGGYDVNRLNPDKLVQSCRYNEKRKSFVVQKNTYAKSAKRLSHYVLGYDTPALNPAGGLKISAKDLAKYMMMHMNKGKVRWRRRVLEEKSEEIMWKRQGNTQYGLSFVYFKNVIPGEELVGMNGANHGIHSAMYFHPEKKYGFVVICNGCNSKSYADSGLNNEVIRMLYNSIIKEH